MSKITSGRKSNIDMTQGVIWKQLVLFAIPLIMGNIFQQLYNTVDSIVVGNYLGTSALAAVGASTPLINMLIGFFMGVAAGAGVLTLVTLAGSSAKAGSTATAYTAAGLALFRKGKEVIKLHYNTPQMAIVT